MLAGVTHSNVTSQHPRGRWTGRR